MFVWCIATKFFGIYKLLLLKCTFFYKINDVNIVSHIFSFEINALGSSVKICNFLARRIIYIAFLFIKIFKNCKIIFIYSIRCGTKLLLMCLINSQLRSSLAVIVTSLFSIIVLQCFNDFVKISSVYSDSFSIEALIKIQGLRAAETTESPRSIILIKRNSACNKGRQASRIIRKGRYVLPGWSSL